MPSTKPYISFDEDGVCGGCKAAIEKSNTAGGIDWADREAQFNSLIEKVKAKKGKYYDAVVGVSGGKDSISQVHRLLEPGLRILAVNVDYGIKTPIGIENLKCVPEMGANLITYRPAQPLHKKLIRIGFEEYGDPDLVSHTLLHAYPLRVALAFEIPLVWLGENSAFEYGGDEDIASKHFITRDWFSKFAAVDGKDPRYVSKKYDIEYEKLIPYDFPDELEQQDYTQAVFMSHFFKWDSEDHLAIAKKYGFVAPEGQREGTFRTYVGIDEMINRIHQYMKVLKFGYGRCSDHACEDIRAGRMTREEAIKIVKEIDLQPLSDEYVDAYCEYLDYTRERFFEIIEQSRNLDIWKKDSDGNWTIPGHLEG
ncbi:MAG: N-acetyl sugar amidotransferase [Candidatus Lindowbacteria bacterium]|nr:N-acetyl sugar amidotransferase [Candidatus Lindowbacteria bacterium]